MRLSSILLLLVAGSGCSTAQRPALAEPDPVHTDGDKYQVVLVNDQVRVLRYHDEPGARTHLHHHPNAVLYALAPFKRRLTLQSGQQRELTFKAGDVVWVPAQSHVGENIGATPTDVLIVEIER